MALTLLTLKIDSKDSITTKMASLSAPALAHALPIAPTYKYIQSERKLPGWRVSKPQIRNRLQPKGVTPGKYMMTHTEAKSRDVRSGKVRTVAPYVNELMSPWQIEFSKTVNRGDNVIVDTVTSTGKTWAANLIVAHEVLERDSRARALIISPNSEVMRDTAGTINTFHNKLYQYNGTVMSTMTRNFVNYDAHRAPTGQIMIVTIDSAIEFLTDPKHVGFVEWLRFVVFDEVHLKVMAESLWWTQFIPHYAQLILLSATLGDPQDVKTIVDRMQKMGVVNEEGMARPRITSVISYYVRPIPLQLVMFKGCDQPTTIVSKALKGAGRLACAISTDPTVRDIGAISPGIKIPEDREAQYKLGQELLAKHPDIVQQKNEQAMKDIITDPSPENILKVLCYLFSNEMQPVMVFHATTEQTRFAAEQIVGLLNRIENEDPEIVAARRAVDRYEKEMERARDKKDTGKEGKKREKDLNKWERAVPEESPKSDDINRLRRLFSVWRFPSEITEEEIPKNMEAWIAACMERGIGVYVSTMPIWLRHFTFDAFREGKIKVLLSDATISVGINLPIRTCVLCGNVPHHLYKQASGRAGRRGMDTKGFIVHLMPEDRIRKYISARSVDFTMQLPERMTYAGLIRLQVPENLDTEEEPSPSASSLPVSDYKLTILQNYSDSLSDQDKLSLNVQLSRIHEDAWPYHRLTNFIKTLPCPESILLVKLLTTGVLHQFEANEFIDLISLLLFRKDRPASPQAEEINSYYVPTFPRFPELIPTLKQYSKHYGININLDHPVHHYFSQFCQGRQYLNMMEEIQDMGEWLYVFKRGLLEMGPVRQLQTPKPGRPDFRGGSVVVKDNEIKEEQLDDFIKMVIKVDGIYLAGIMRKKVIED